MQDRTGLVLCALTLLIGFLMIFLGAFFVSSDSIVLCQKNLVLAYLLLLLGFGMLLSGIFWSTYQQASKSKGMFSHVFRQHLAHEDPPLATVDRPDFYPPAYEESPDAEKWARAAEGEALGVPPPLYTEMGLELKDGSEAHPEAPPSYQESVTHLVAAATSEGAARPRPELRAGHAVQHPGCTPVGAQLLIRAAKLCGTATHFHGPAPPRTGSMGPLVRCGQHQADISEDSP